MVPPSGARLAALAAFFIPLVAAQDPIEVCACQPSVYNMTINRQLRCDDKTVGGQGILEVSCVVSTDLDEDANVTDFVPIKINEFTVAESNGENEIVDFTTFTDGPYFDGHTFMYTSIVRRISANSSTMPRSFQVNIKGVNADLQPIGNTWRIDYDNDCSIFPLLSVGQFIGWTNFVSISSLPLGHCNKNPSNRLFLLCNYCRLFLVTLH